MNIPSRLQAFLAFLWAGIFAVSCSAASTQGPNTWIDRPLDESNFPLASLILQAHASDLDGVSRMEFYAADQLVGAVDLGGSRLADASIEWMPPAPGAYAIRVRAVDGQGNPGLPALAQIVVEGTAEPSPTATPGAPSGTPTRRSVTLTLSITPSLSASKTILANPFLTANQNVNCRSGPGTVYEVFNAVLKGETALIQGKNQEGSWLWVQKPGHTQRCWVSTASVTIEGDLGRTPVMAAPEIPPEPQPITETPTARAQNLTDTPQPADTTPPEIIGTSALPDLVVVDGPGCVDSARTVNLRAAITDDVGISSVTASWTVGSQSGETALTPSGGSNYETVLGPFSESGTLSIVIVARDLGGNTSEAQTGAVQVMNCPG